MAATPNCQIVENAVLVKFPDARFGKYNCRHIGSNAMRSWSQHAASEPDRKYFANALDIWHVDHMLPGKPADSSLAHQLWLRQVYGFLRATFPNLVDQLLGPGDKSHSNHVHVSTWPKMKSNWWYRPPCRGGTLVVIYEDGTEGDTFGALAPPPPPPLEEDDLFCELGDADSENVRYWQLRMNRVGGGLTVDGGYGTSTQTAVVNLAGGDGMQIHAFEADAIEAVINDRTSPVAAKEHNHDDEYSTQGHGHTATTTIE